MTGQDMTAGDMAALHQRSFTVPRPWGAEEFAGLLLDPLCFTLFESGGFLMGRTVADEAEILTLAVDPAARRQGIGARLVQRFMNSAKIRGAATAFLEVASDNGPAIALYLQAGFAKVGLRRGYYTSRHAAALDAVVMQCAVCQTPD